MNDVFVHATAIAESDRIGTGTRIWAFAHVMKGAVVGESCNIGEHCFVEGGAVVGSGCTIKNGNMLWEGVTLEDGVFVGPHVFFTNDRYPRSPRLPSAKPRYAEKATWLLPTKVKEGASLGAGAVLLPGITIGEYAMVAAGSVVTKDVQPYSLVRGNPARPSGWVCRCGQRLGVVGDTAECAACGERFLAADGQLHATVLRP